MEAWMGIIFGIIAMLGWGTADFFVAKAVRKTTPIQTLFWSRLVSVAFFAVVFAALFKIPVMSEEMAWLILAAGLLNVISFLAFYKGLQVGMVSVVSPVAACWAAVGIVLSIVFLGETLTGQQAAGAVLAVAGVFLVSFRWKDLAKIRLAKSTGVEYGIIVMITWGVAVVVLGRLVAELGWLVPMLFMETAAFLYLFAYAGTAKKKVWSPKSIALLAVLIGVLESVAFLSYGVAVSLKFTAVVAPIAAAFPAVTIILARVFLNEKMSANQMLGAASILAGLVLLAV